MPVGRAPAAWASRPIRLPWPRSARGRSSGSATTFDAAASSAPYGAITSYAWSFGDGSSATTTSASTTHTYASPGTYTATLTRDRLGGDLGHPGLHRPDHVSQRRPLRHGQPLGVIAASAAAASTAGSVLAATPHGKGYWIATPDGGVFSTATRFHGSLVGTVTLDAPITGIASTPDGGGYWMVGADGGVFAEGMRPSWDRWAASPSTPRSAGSWPPRPGTATGWSPEMAGSSLSVTPPTWAPWAGPTSTQASSAWRPSSGHGYWLVGSDGGIFAFGDAPYDGSVAGLALAQPVLGVAPTPVRARLLARGQGRRGLRRRRRAPSLAPSPDRRTMAVRWSAWWPGQVAPTTRSSAATGRPRPSRPEPFGPLDRPVPRA